MESAFTFNILITSLAAKVPLAKAVKQACEQIGFKGKIIGGDSQTPCIGSFFVDRFWKMPSLHTLTPDQLLEECQKQQIQAIIPTRDADLQFFAEHKTLFQKQGIHLFISPAKVVATCLDKELFALFLKKQGFPGIETSQNLSSLNAKTYVVKERFGAGSRKIGLNLTQKQAEEWAKDLDQPLFQPYIQGIEYSVDLYLTLKGQVHGSLVRKRDFVIRGESQITTSVKQSQIENLCAAVAENLGLYGHVVMQLIESEEKLLHLIECNPRFGGASTLSIAMGLDSFTWFFLECLGQHLPPFVRSREEKQQVRYPHDLIITPTSSQ